MIGKCSICRKENVPIANYKVWDCKGRVGHVKDVCTDCVQVCEQNADFEKEE